MRVLVGCERSGIVRNAFAKAGHDAWSCDTEPSRQAGNHLQCNLLDVLHDGWDLLVCHPPCTYLCVSGLHWNVCNPERQQLTEEALDFVRVLLDAPIEHICLENPVSCISTRIRRPDQIIQPYQFGEDASKTTCLWMKNLPPLKPTKRIAGRIVEWNGKLVERWSNQTDSGQNKEPPSKNRQEIRSQTYQGIADAMANQWTETKLRKMERQLMLFTL